MMNHEALWAGISFVCTCIGYVLGRAMRPKPIDPESKESEESEESEESHPYRDPAVLDAEPPPKKRVHPYHTHDDKTVYLSCPACGGRVSEMPVCDCDEVEEPNVHFHTVCAICRYRFAMETRTTWQRRKQEKKEQEKREKEGKPN